MKISLSSRLRDSRPRRKAYRMLPGRLGGTDGVQRGFREWSWEKKGRPGKIDFFPLQADKFKSHNFLE
jgi:hypothetical protein